MHSTRALPTTVFVEIQHRLSVAGLTRADSAAIARGIERSRIVQDELAAPTRDPQRIATAIGTAASLFHSGVVVEALRGGRAALALTCAARLMNHLDDSVQAGIAGMAACLQTRLKHEGLSGEKLGDVSDALMQSNAFFVAVVSARPAAMVRALAEASNEVASPELASAVRSDCAKHSLLQAFYGRDNATAQTAQRADRLEHV